MNMGERIKELRKSLELTQKDFGERLGVKGNTIAQYEIGRNEPVDAVVSLICREFGVSEAWLRDGDGGMMEPGAEGELDALCRKYGASDWERAFLEKYLKLTDAERGAVTRFMEELAAQNGDPAAPESYPLGKDGAAGMDSESLAALSTDEKVALYRSELEREEKAAGGSAAS